MLSAAVKIEDAPTAVLTSIPIPYRINVKM